MRFLSLLTLICAVSLGAAERPNILLIVADDLGWADVGWHGGFGKTPHMDKLVRTGAELDQHYVQPVCTPTRAALMSGRCPGRFGPQALSPSNLRAMPLGTTTLASALKSVGYRTHLAGKWHLGAQPEWIPNAYGFDTSYGTLAGAADPWTHKYRKGDPYEDTWHRDGKFFREEGNATELIAAEALKRITQGGDQPWFMYVPFHAVHTPVDAPTEYKRLYDGVKFHDDPVKHESRLRMAAMIAQLDAKVGAFVAALERTGQREKTLIIFTSDNGGTESLQNHYVGNVPHSPLNSENDPLRGQKDTLYEGGTRVCAFAHWPGKLKPAKIVAPLYVGDWLPTIAGLTGFQPAQDPKWDGLNRWKVLTGEDATLAPRTIYIGHARGRSIRHGDWKLIAMNSGKSELFNIAADPYEQNDLAKEKPELVNKLNGLITGFLKDTEAVIPKLNPAFGKVVATPKDPLMGWKNRNCSASVKDGILTAKGSGPAPFLGVVAELTGPAKVTFRLRTATGGEGHFDLMPTASSKTTEIAAFLYSTKAGEWQEITVDLPHQGPAKIMRLYLPHASEAVDIDWVELTPAGAKPSRWEF